MKSTKSADPSFWEERYQAGNLPWESYGVPEVIKDVLTTMKTIGKVFLTGCGAAYEIKTFLEAGWDAWKINFSETGVGPTVYYKRCHSITFIQKNETDWHLL